MAARRRSSSGSSGSGSKHPSRKGSSGTSSSRTPRKKAGGARKAGRKPTRGPEAGHEPTGGARKTGRKPKAGPRKAARKTTRGTRKAAAEAAGGAASGHRGGSDAGGEGPPRDVVASIPVEVGRVVHAYPHAGAAVVALTGELRAGDAIAVRGATTDFCARVERLERDGAPIETGRAGEQIGVALPHRVREHDRVFRLSR